MSLTTTVDPNSSALALEFMGENAGLAASVYGTLFFFIGSSIGAFISSNLLNGVEFLIGSAVVLSGIALSLVLLNKKGKVI